MHAQGTDYTESSVPEGGTARAIGAESTIAGDPKDHSTRDLIRLVLDRFGARQSAR